MQPDGDKEAVQILKKLKGKREKSKNPLTRFLYTVFHSVTWLLNLFLVLLYLLALLSMVLSPEQVVFPAFLGLAFPFLLLGILLFTLYRLVSRYWKGFFFNLLILLFSWSPIRTYIPLHRFPQALPENTIKVLSLNCNAFGFIKHREDKPNPTLQYLKESEADIICLQEAYTFGRSSSYVSLQHIAAYLPEYPYVVLRFAQKDRGTSLMLLSKFPVRDTRLLDLESRFNGGVVYTLDVNGKEVQLYNLHLESFRLSSDEGDKYVALVKEGEPLAFKDEVTAKLTPGFVKRSLQADKISVDCQQSKTPYVIICGDFNDSPISYTHSRIASGLKDAYASSGRGLGYSFTFKRFGVRIDHILHSPKIVSYNCAIDSKADISDHKPISCHLALQD